MTTTLLCTLTLVAAFAITAAVTPFIRRLATHVGMHDEVGDRRMHEKPVPRIGGIGLYLGFAVALFGTIGYAVQFTPYVRDVEVIHQTLGLLFGGTLIMLIGVWDDIMGMRPRTKFLAQIIVALLSMLYGFHIPGSQNVFSAQHEWVAFPLWLSVPLTLVWYLGMMNAINFIDGLDGLLSGLTAISGVFLLAIALLHGHVVVALAVAGLVGGALGFLPYNFNPAKIILGDSGALFIGYTFATISIMGTSKTAAFISLLVPVILLGLPIVDTAVTIVRRTRAGKRITEADRGHFHHQLVFRFGLNVRQAVLLIYALCFLLGVTALVLSGSLGGLRIASVL